ncbi:MAG: signal peptidase I [Leptolyngbyaceae cyanobacterium MO_188.B28]|nr:signal peptidase I [Leptolyngbyaceae cyanobacterium MO_188.B28]
MTSHTSTRDKEPWLAVILSTLFPGIGQIYAGQRLRGVVWIIATVVLTVLLGWIILSPTGSINLGFQLFIGYLILSVLNLFDAHRCVRQSNSNEFERLRKSDKDPWLAVFLSDILPGLGHLYQKQWVWAGLFFSLFIVLLGLTGAIPLIQILVIALSLYCIYHSYQTSPTGRPKFERLIIRVCLLLLLFQLLSFASAIGIRAGVAEARYIPSGAMEPTLQINDRLIIEKISYRFDSPKRGDIVVFWPPDQLFPASSRRDAFIKRVIGLPGERIEIIGGQVLVGDQALEEPYIKAPPDYQWGPEVVPQKAYFVLGDNRNSSYDSHSWGFLPEQNIFGKASKIFWPPDRAGIIR